MKLLPTMLVPTHAPTNPAWADWRMTDTVLAADVGTRPEALWDASRVSVTLVREGHTDADDAADVVGNVVNVSQVGDSMQVALAVVNFNGQGMLRDLLLVVPGAACVIID